MLQILSGNRIERFTKKILKVDKSFFYLKGKQGLKICFKKKIK